MQTENQHKAANPAHSVWVSANAGTGKTKVLTDRVLRLLLDGVLASRILCITYTKAAAAEMESRIYKELGQWAVVSEDTLRLQLETLTQKAISEKHMARARMLFALVLEDPEGVRIETIHGFCQSLLRKFPLEAGVEPHFTVIDERTASELLDESKLRLVSHTGHADAGLMRALQKLIGNISEFSFNKLMDNIVSQRRKLVELLDKPLGITQLITNIYSELGLDKNSTYASILRDAFDYTDADKHMLQEVGKALAVKNVKDGAIFSDWANADIRSLEAWNAYQLYYLTKAGTPRKSIPDTTFSKQYLQFTEFLLQEQQRVERVLPRVNALFIAQNSESLVVVAESLLKLYEHLKRQRAVLDYDDLIIIALRLLQRPGISPWILFKLDNGLDHLLIDEAQDTSFEQWELVEALIQDFFVGESKAERERSLFVVGDEKQSIYSFQGAAPKEFHYRKDAFTTRAYAAQKSFEHVKLDLSFRSTAPVLEAVDTVFAGETHNASRNGHAGVVELWPLLSADKKEDQGVWPIAKEYENSPLPSNQLAQRIAAKISEWIAGNRTLPSTGKGITAGDILILVRKRSGFVYYLQRALKKYNIPVAGADRLMLADNIAVMDMLALAQFLLLPEDDLNLATLLKSPLCNLDEEGLFELAYERDGLTLWQRIYHSGKHDKIVEELSYLLSRADYIAPYELFSYVLERMDGSARFARRMGSEVSEPLDELLSQALLFERSHAPSLQGFLQWLTHGDTEIKRDMEQGRNEVRIMTVHGAKGLQAPIVFLPDTVGMPPHNYNLLWNENALFWESSSSRDVPKTDLLRRELRGAEDAEYLRLLYVAMTRAEDELYICGAKDGVKELSDLCWYKVVDRAIGPLAEVADIFFSDSSEPVSVLRISTPQTAELIQKKVHAPESVITDLPDFARTKPPEEPTPRRPLTPSRMGEDPAADSPLKQQQHYARGLLVHKLLEFLPSLPAGQRLEAAKRYCERYAKIDDALIGEVMAVLSHPDFVPLFGEDSLAEVAISGMVRDGVGELRVINGQMDRLCVMSDRILVVDYKTNRQPPSSVEVVSLIYLRQMAAYRALLQDIYPDRAVECALLWIEGPILMPIPEKLLAGLDCVVVST